MDTEFEDLVPEEELAIGFAQDTGDGLIFEIENDSVIRRVEFAGGCLATSSLVNAANCEEYLEECAAEFELELIGPDGPVTLSSRQCELAGHEWAIWEADVKRIRVDLRCALGNSLLPVSVFYEVRAGDEAITKWLEVGPAQQSKWKLTGVHLERMRLKEMVEGVRTSAKRAVSLEDPHKPERFEYGGESNCVINFWGYHEGLFFFTQSATGSERFSHEAGLLMSESLDADLSEKVTTGASAIGGYDGPQEMGFRRFGEHLARWWAADSGEELDHLDNHLLAQCPQQRLTLPSGTGTALDWRQAMYLATWEHPYSSIVSGWQGPDLEDRHTAYELMSMIGHWAVEKAPLPDGAPAEIAEFAGKLEKFRGEYIGLFADYRHVLGYPDGAHVEGYAHFLDDRGLIVLINPTREEKNARVPLDEPELQLDGEAKHRLTDLTSLTDAKDLGSQLPRKAPSVSIPPMQVKFIGVNI